MLFPSCWVGKNFLFQIKCCVFNLSVLFFGLAGCYEVCSLPDLNLKQQFQVVKSVLLHFILEAKSESIKYNIHQTIRNIAWEMRQTHHINSDSLEKQAIQYSFFGSIWNIAQLIAFLMLHTQNLQLFHNLYWPPTPNKLEVNIQFDISIFKSIWHCIKFCGKHKKVSSVYHLAKS